MNHLDKSCFSKRRFETEEAALAQAAGAFTGFTLRAYKCPNCRAWHLTKKPARGRAAQEGTVRSVTPRA